jgi:hypothetical protein
MWSSLHAFLRYTFSRLYDYDENFSERSIRCPLPRTVVGPSHLGHEVLDCQVNVHFEEGRPCGKQET